MIFKTKATEKAPTKAAGFPRIQRQALIFNQESKEKFPDVGAQVQTKDGQGVVRSIDVFSETLKIQLEDKTTPLVYALEEVLING